MPISTGTLTALHRPGGLAGVRPALPLHLVGGIGR